MFSLSPLLLLIVLISIVVHAAPMTTQQENTNEVLAEVKLQQGKGSLTSLSDPAKIYHDVVTNIDNLNIRPDVIPTLGSQSPCQSGGTQNAGTAPHDMSAHGSMAH